MRREDPIDTAPDMRKDSVHQETDGLEHARHRRRTTNNSRRVVGHRSREREFKDTGKTPAIRKKMHTIHAHRSLIHRLNPDFVQDERGELQLLRLGSAGHRRGQRARRVHEEHLLLLRVHQRRVMRVRGARGVGRVGVDRDVAPLHVVRIRVAHGQHAQVLQHELPQRTGERLRRAHRHGGHRRRRRARSIACRGTGSHCWRDVEVLVRRELEQAHIQRQGRARVHGVPVPLEGGLVRLRDLEHVPLEPALLHVLRAGEDTHPVPVALAVLPRLALRVSGVGRVS